MVSTELEQIQQGIFKPLTISDGIKEAFERNSRNLGSPNPFTAVEPFINNMIEFFSNMPLELDALPSFPNPFKNIELSPTDTSYLPPSGPPIGPASNMTNVDPQTGLTATELALLPPDDQAIRQKLNRRI